MIKSKLVYIASPYAGDTEVNIQFAKKACRYAVNQGMTPLAVHLLYPQFLNDQLPSDRECGMRMGLHVLESCDELWLCGDYISSGMEMELAAAKALGIPIQKIASHTIEKEQMNAIEQDARDLLVKMV